MGDVFELSTVLGDYEELRDAVDLAGSHQMVLEESHLELEAKIEKGEAIEAAALRKLLERNLKATQGTREFLKRYYQAVPISLRYTPASPIKVPHVLWTPELLGNIARFLHPSDVLQVPRIINAGKQLFEEQPEFQDKLNLRLTPSGYFNNPFAVDSFGQQCGRESGGTSFYGFSITQRYSYQMMNGISTDQHYMHIQASFDQFKSPFHRWHSLP